MSFRKILTIIFLLSVTVGTAYYSCTYFFTDAPVELEVAAPINMYGNAKKGGFNSLTQEFVFDALPVRGSVPTWLDGKLLLTGPSQFEVGKSTIKYWYNALSMLHSFSFNKGNVSYRNALLRGHYYNQTIKRGQYDPTLCQDQKKPSFFSRLSKAFKDVDPYDNGNLSIWQFNKNFYALTETPQAAVFDPNTLKTKGMFEFKDNLQGHLTTANYQYDPHTKAWYNYMTQFGASSYYHIYKVAQGSHARQLITTIPVKSPSYMRTFSMTKNYIVLIETPFVITSPMDLALSGKTFIDCLSWQPNRGTSFIVINKQTGSVVGTYKTPAFFLFNQLQAREENNTIQLDVITYDNPRIVKQTQMKYLRNNYTRECEPSFLHRFKINLVTGVVNDTLISNAIIEAPSIHPAYTDKDYTYCYGVSTHETFKFPNMLIKLNVRNGKVQKWDEQGCFPSKPVFIPKPKCSVEDEGVICSVVFDCNSQRSFMVVLDARTFKEIARAQLPHHIPFGISGTYFSKSQLS